MRTYTVKQGDSLSIIARDYLGDMTLWPLIAQLNNITNVDVIFPGQVLKLPDPPKPTLSTAGVGGWVGGIFLLLVVIGTALNNRKKNKSKEKEVKK